MNIVRSCGGRCSVGKGICVMREMVQHHEIHDYRVSFESRYGYVGFQSSTLCQQLQSEDGNITQDNSNRVLTVIDKPIRV